MTRSGENDRRPEADHERADAEQRLRSEVHDGLRGILYALALTAVIAVPAVAWLTRTIFATGFMISLLVICGAFIVVRYLQAGDRELKKLLGTSSK